MRGLRLPKINGPSAVFEDGSGNTFIADGGAVTGQRILEIAAATGLIQTVAGGNGAGYFGDSGPPAPRSSTPAACFVDGSNVYIAEFGNNVIREFTVGGNIQTVAGNGINGGLAELGFPDGFSGFIGDGGLATSAELNQPYEVFTDASHNIFIAEDFFGVREVVAATGNIQTVAGTGTPGYSGDGGHCTVSECTGSPGSAIQEMYNNGRELNLDDVHAVLNGRRVALRGLREPVCNRIARLGRSNVLSPL